MFIRFIISLVVFIVIILIIKDFIDGGAIVGELLDKAKELYADIEKLNGGRK